jgi:hypothetical protein
MEWNMYPPTSPKVLIGKEKIYMGDGIMDTTICEGGNSKTKQTNLRLKIKKYKNKHMILIFNK